HAYAAAGTYLVTLTITDVTGQTASVSRSLSVGRSSQAITFTSTAPSAAIVGGPPYTVSATASSGLAVTFSSAAPSVCAVSGSTVSFLGAGTCAIDANQAGDAAYSPAPQAQQSFAVGAQAAAPAPAQGTALLPPGPAFAAAPFSGFGPLGATVDQTTGAITFTASFANAG